jgi:hypothetical protein
VISCGKRIKRHRQTSKRRNDECIVERIVQIPDMSSKSKHVCVVKQSTTRLKNSADFDLPHAPVHGIPRDKDTAVEPQYGYNSKQAEFSAALRCVTP